MAAPSYLRLHGTPDSVEALSQHRRLIARENGHSMAQGMDVWHLRQCNLETLNDSATSVRVRGPLSSNSGELARGWCLAGQGIMLRSVWGVAPQFKKGLLVHVLAQQVMPDADIHWLAPYRAEARRRIRLLIDFLVAQFETEPWKTTLPTASRVEPPS